MSSSTEVVPIDYITVPVKVWEDIPKAVQCSPNVTVAVNNNLKLYASISVNDAMKSLATVGDLLKVANAAAHGFPCSVPIIAILSDYQSLVNDTVNTCSTFVFNCIGAINQHALALRIAADFPQKAMAMISKTAEKAKEMAEQSQKLVDFAKKLVDKSTEALTMATGDQKDTMAAEREVQKKQGELEAQAAKLQSEIADLKEQVAEFKELAEKAGKEAAEQRKIGMILQIVGAVTKPLAQLAGPIISAASGAGVAGSAGKILGNLTGGGKTEDEKEPKKETEKPTGDDATSQIKDKKKKLEKKEDDKTKELEEKKDELKKVEAEPDSEEKKQKKEKLEKEISEIKDALKELGESLSNVATEIANEYKERASKSEDKEAAYMKLKSEYQDLQRKSNADLAQNVVQLKNLAVEKNYLEVSIKSLEITIKTMGRVRTIFENTRLFWLQVKAQCDSLSDVSNIKDLAEIAELSVKYQTDFTNQIKSSGLNWLALAQINFVASNAITGVKKNFDEVMSNLPGKAEAEAIVKACCDEIEQALTEENKKIDEIKKESDKLANKPKEA
ncbi:hypothetical protein DDB_G0270088 [Dictyostelium discoideum AX4]|uniref:Uncharacterized protein n=1 Tax=Dictyostelium discoideum TaxID=44689 RepID=Q55CE9_DICDI|nr:hypothetical protein DDB_G0270088 [Dictyostelium discoideum AX4]EAL72394.1 hypothetical protein DDB_G0270088 [Dictyostelium discoideum AX4]|eukprot:XP_646532.1 hypothetical protein DDB_G0270088 [Dictyostelium discoideum AX4]